VPWLLLLILKINEMKTTLSLLVLLSLFFHVASAQGVYPIKKADDLAGITNEYDYLFRIRIFSSNRNVSDIKITIDPNNLNADINKINKEPMVFWGLIRTTAFDINYKFNGADTIFHWLIKPAETNVEIFTRFEKELSNHRLSMGTDNDPALFQCINLNASINLQIQYTFKSNTSLQPEQKLISLPSFIDNDGVITLPALYESNFPNVDINISNFETVFDARINSLKLKVVENGSCDGTNCVSYFDVEKKITAFYINRIKKNQTVSDIIVAIQPDPELNSVTIIYKKVQTKLPYSSKTISDYLSSGPRRRLIGLKKKCLKGEVYSRCNKRSAMTTRSFKFKVNRTYSGGEVLLPGDLIYIK
jgi:hypothetical protein